MRVHILAVTAALTLGAATPLDAQESRRECPALPTSSILLATHAFDVCQVDKQARRSGGEPKLAWRQTPGNVDPGSCYGAEFEFVVDTMGAVEEASIRLLDRWRLLRMRCGRASPSFATNPRGSRAVRCDRW